MNTTIDQWEVLEAVVQSGSFAAAAARMNRSQSTISYAISRLQEKFEAPLLEMKGRRAQLTEAGKALLAQAEPLLAGFRALEQEEASAGRAPIMHLNISVDSLFPNQRLFVALSELTRIYPYLHPRIHKCHLVSSVHEFANIGADLCITALPAHELFVKPILDVRMRAVATADHPLLNLNRELTRLDLVQHPAVIIEGTGTEGRRQPQSESQPHLVVNTIESAIEAVRTGMCFGWLPVYRIAPYLSSGELAALPLPLGGERSVRMSLVLKERSPRRHEQNTLAELLGADRDLEVV